MPPPPPPNPTQSTDIKVNEVTPALFARAPDAASMALVPVAEAQAFIRVLGLAPTKAKNLVAMSKVREGRQRVVCLFVACALLLHCSPLLVAAYQSKVN